MSLYVALVPENTKRVCFEIDGGPHYDRMILVTEEDDGETLFLQGWIGKPLTPSHWLALKHDLYPKARRARFERWCARRQAWRMAWLKLPASDD